MLSLEIIFSFAPAIWFGSGVFLFFGLFPVFERLQDKAVSLALYVKSIDLYIKFSAVCAVAFLISVFFLSAATSSYVPWDMIAFLGIASLIFLSQRTNQALKHLSAGALGLARAAILPFAKYVMLFNIAISGLVVF